MEEPPAKEGEEEGDWSDLAKRESTQNPITTTLCLKCCHPPLPGINFAIGEVRFLKSSHR